MTVSQVVNAVSDSVVAINTEVQTTNFFMQQVTGQAAGSGVIISQDGYLLTNNHVIENATKVSVTLKNGESYDAALVGTDPETDLAVIKIDAGGCRPPSSAAPPRCRWGMKRSPSAIRSANWAAPSPTASSAPSTVRSPSMTVQ